MRTTEPDSISGPVYQGLDASHTGREVTCIGGLGASGGRRHCGHIGEVLEYLIWCYQARVDGQPVSSLIPLRLGHSGCLKGH